jgi:hypothetical protein
LIINELSLNIVKPRWEPGGFRRITPDCALGIQFA